MTEPVLAMSASLELRSDAKPPAKIPPHLLPPAVQQWLTAMHERSPNTGDAYHRAVSSWLLWCLAEDVNPEAATIANAEAWARALAGTGLGKRSVNARVSACSSLYRRLLAEKRVEFNPFGALVSVKVKTSRLKTPAMSEKHSTAVLAKAGSDGEHPAHAAVAELLLTTAARASEIAGANLGHLRANEDGGWDLIVTRKGGEEQDLPVTSDALKAIRRANAERSDLDDPDAPLVLAPRGGRYSRHTISRLVHRFATEGAATAEERDVAKLVTAHTTRRTAITTFVDGGGDLRTAQTLAGHSDPRTTENYIRARNDRRKHAAAAAILAAKFHR